jgi:hypothetical protein
MILMELIERLSVKYGFGTVFLVDEYDSPASSHIADIKLAKANAKALSGLYAATKNSINHLRFAMLTGVTTYATASGDTGANNFKDLTLSQDLCRICGFTFKEFDDLFHDRT